MEQNLKLAGAMVDLITLATGLYGFASAEKNLGMKQMARLAMVELTADVVTAITVATIGEYQNWPPGLTLLLSLKQDTPEFYFCEKASRHKESTGFLHPLISLDFSYVPVSFPELFI